MTNKLIITRGLPGSGKTTWSRAWVNESPKTRVRVNRDDIRNLLGPYWVPTREDFVTRVEDSIIIQALKDNFDVVVDATNFKGSDRFNLLLKKNVMLMIDLEIKDFTHIPVETCIERDSKRDNPVGEKVIMDFYEKYINKQYV